MQILSNIPVGVAYPQKTKIEAANFLSEGLDASVSKPLLRLLVHELENMGLLRCKEFHDEESGTSYA